MTLFGCAQTPPPPQPVKTKVIYRYPPSAYLAKCVVPPFHGTTWADLAVDNEVLISVIKSCDQRLEKIRTWRQVQQEKVNNDSAQ